MDGRTDTGSSSDSQQNCFPTVAKATWLFRLLAPLYMLSYHLSVTDRIPLGINCICHLA